MSYLSVVEVHTCWKDYEMDAILEETDVVATNETPAEDPPHWMQLAKQEIGDPPDDAGAACVPLSQCHQGRA